MNIKTFTQLLTAIAGTTVTLFYQSPHAIAMNIIDDTYGVGAGSFELGNFVNNGLDFMSLFPGNNTTITGWTVGGPGNGIDWLIENGYNADTGIQSVDLSNSSRSSISTTIPTTIGDTYQLSFATSASSIIGSFTAQGFVSAGSLTNQEFIATTVSPTISNQVYNFHDFEFTANDALTTLTFTAGNPSSAYGPVIDSVSVVLNSPVPVPESSNILGLIVVGAGFVFTGIKCKKNKKEEN